MTSDQKIIDEVSSGVFSYLEKIKKTSLANSIGNKIVRMADAPCVVEVPKDLTKIQKEKLSSEVYKIIGKQVRINFLVKPNLIDGIIVKYSDKVWDLSVLSQIDELKV